MLFRIAGAAFPAVLVAIIHLVARRSEHPRRAEPHIAINNPTLCSTLQNHTTSCTTAIIWAVIVAVTIAAGVLSGVHKTQSSYNRALRYYVRVCYALSLA